MARSDATASYGSVESEPMAGWRARQDHPPLPDWPPASRGSATIAGTLFEDLNHDAVQDGHDRAQAGWRVFLDANGNGHLDRGERSAISDAAGRYEFRDLAAGSHHVVMQTPFGWQHWSFGDADASAATGDAESGSPIDRLEVAVAAS